MFDDLLRELKRLEQPQTISIDLPLDDEGYLDRSCPNDECGSGYKVLHEDWRAKVPDERAVCPICGHEDEPSAFVTEDQERFVQDHALAHVEGQLQQALRRSTPRKEKAGFLEMTLTYQPRPRRIIAPIEAAEAMEQRSECEVCGTRYASIGAAFFCPACGHNSALSTFEGALATIRETMALGGRLRELMSSKAAAADTARIMAENSLVRLWSSFQRFAEAVYLALGSDLEKPRRNAFQNLADSDRLWTGAIGRTYADMLSEAEQRDLVRLVQQRHVLVHQDAVVDQDYLDKSGDHRYRLGQRLVVGPGAVLRLAEIVETLATELRSAKRT